MINLMPPVQQKEVRAARSNALLIRYIILLVVALVFLLAAMGATYFTLTTAAQQADDARQQNEQEATGYSETQATADKLRRDLASAKSLFDSEVLYSKVLVRFSQLLPEGAAVNSLQLSDESLTQPINLTVSIRNRSTAESLIQNFNSSPYIANASLGSVSTNSASSQYPYTADLEFTFQGDVAR